MLGHQRAGLGREQGRRQQRQVRRAFPLPSQGNQIHPRGIICNTRQDAATLKLASLSSYLWGHELPSHQPCSVIRTNKAHLYIFMGGVLVQLRLVALMLYTCMRGLVLTKCSAVPAACLQAGRYSSSSSSSARAAGALAWKSLCCGCMLLLLLLLLQTTGTLMAGTSY